MPLALLCAFALHGEAGAQRTLYHCTDALGRTTLQDSPCDGSQTMQKRYRTMMPDAETGQSKAGTGPRRSSSAPRRVRDNTYLCAALSEERQGADGRLREAAADRTDYWREQLRRIDKAMCAQGCRQC